MRIESVSNKNVQLIRRLADRSNRRAEGLFVVEGINIIKDIPKDTALHSIYIAEDKAEEYCVFADTLNCPVYILSDRVFKMVSDTVTPSGILAVAFLPENADLMDLDDKIIVLDGIRDPGNLGTIIRTAAAFGYRDAVLIESADAYSNKAIRSSMGGIFRIRIHEASRENFINQIDHPLYILDMRGEDISEFVPERRFALAVGSEAHGISEELLSKAAKVLKIEMKGDIESLNAAVSIGIAMYFLEKS